MVDIIVTRKFLDAKLACFFYWKQSFDYFLINNHFLSFIYGNFRYTFQVEVIMLNKNFQDDQVCQYSIFI